MALFIFQYGGRGANQLRVQHGIPQHPVKGEPQVLTITKHFYSSTVYSSKHFHYHRVKVIITVDNKTYNCMVTISLENPDPYEPALTLFSWIRFRIRIGNVDPDPKKKKVKKFHVMKCWMFSFEGWRLLLYSLDVLHQRPRDKKTAIFNQKKKIFSAVLFYNCWSSKPWIRIRIDLNCYN